MILLGKRQGRWYIRFRTEHQDISERSITFAGNGKQLTVHWSPYHLFANIYKEKPIGE